MDYRKLLGRAWSIVWEHKFLILLGILVALGSSSGSGSISRGSRSLYQPAQEWRLPLAPDWLAVPTRSLDKAYLPALSPLAAGALAGVALTIVLAIWVLSTLSRGALIAGAGTVDAGGATNLGRAFAAAWEKGWTLLGIGLFPAIPAFVLLSCALGAGAIYVGMAPAINGLDRAAGPRNLWLILGALTCMALPLLIALNTLRASANRACLLEGCGVLAAYGRGFGVLVDHIAPALGLLLVQVAISAALGLGLLLPALCCLLWPVLLVVQGMAAAFFSTMWTLAWRQWASAAAAA